MGKQIRKQKKSSIIAGGFLRFGIYLCVVIGVIFIGKSAYDFGYEIFNQEAMADKENGRDITVVLKKGDSVYQIGKILKKKGLIEDAKIFVVQEKLSNYKGKLQTGTYILNTSMTPDELWQFWQKRIQRGSRIRQMQTVQQRKAVLILKENLKKSKGERPHDCRRENGYLYEFSGQRKYSLFK